jgi:putative transposase
MKRLRFSEQQIAFILRQAEEGTTVKEVCRKAGISCR